MKTQNHKSVNHDTQSCQMAVSGSVILPTHLRIGNIVNLLSGEEDYYEIRSFDNEVMSFKGHISWDYIRYDEVEAIPITKEWLLKLGFKQKGSFYRIEDSRFVEVLIHDEGIDVCNHSVYLPHIKSVYQLQNLYFSLIGSELRLVL